MLLLLIILPGAYTPSPAFAVLSGTPIPKAQVYLLDTTNTQSIGVYLGEGIILTSWQNITSEQQFWNIRAEQAPPLRHQLAWYLNDGEDQSPELAIHLMMCPAEDGYEISPSASPDLHTDCLPYNLADGMRVVSEDRELEVSIESLLYASRELDIAILTVNPDVLSTTFPSLESARLDAYPLTDEQVLRSLSSGHINFIPRHVVVSSAPNWLHNPLHGAFDGSAQLSNVVSIRNVMMRQSARLSKGQPYFSADGSVAGLYWGTNQQGLGGQATDFMNPTAIWYQTLWSVQEQLDHAGLRTVLENALLPVEVIGEPSIGDRFAPELGNMGYDALHYTLDLAIDPTIPSISGTVTLQAKATYHHLAQISLDLRNMDVMSVSVDGEIVDFQVEARKLVIQLPSPFDYGTIFEVVITYNGDPQPTDTPYGRTFTVGLEYSDDPPRLAFINQPDGANTWFPCNDHPADLATYDFHITVPDGYQAVANGIPSEPTANADNSSTFHWRMDQPMQTALVLVAVADYVLIENELPNGVIVRDYAYDGTEEKVADVLSSTGLAFEYLETFFGEYPYDSYGHVVTPMSDGALETQTMTAVSHSISQSDSEEQLFTLVVHELAHHWYGNSVVLQSWEDIWLNEGFATYAEWLALEQRYGPDEQFLRQRNLQERAVESSSRRTPLAYPLANQMFSSDSYMKGAWVLHMLRVQLGDDIFFELLQAWAAQYANQPATTLDFFRLAEQISNRDLTRFRRQWLETSGVPDYILVWSKTENGVEVRACNQRDEPYVLDVSIQFTDLDVTTTILDFHLADDAAQVYQLEFEPTELVIDPKQQILGSLRVQLTDGTPSCILSLGDDDY